MDTHRHKQDDALGFSGRTDTLSAYSHTAVCWLHGASEKAVRAAAAVTEDLKVFKLQQMLQHTFRDCNKQSAINTK